MTRSPGSGYNFTARVAALPWYQDGGDRLLHVGASASYRASRSSGRTTGFSSRPALHLAPTFVRTGTLAVDDAALIGAEAALVSGPFSVQAEGMCAHTDGRGASGDGDFWGAYLEASYFLTGERRIYKRASGTFGRTKPKNNVGAGGLGAWQVATRYDHVDLNDGRTRGGVLGQWTVGLNGYLSPNARLMFNYASGRLHGIGRADLVGVRCQVDS